MNELYHQQLGMSGASSPKGERPRAARFDGDTSKKKAVSRSSIGLSSVQGAVSGLKDYAAVHAIKEGEAFLLSSMWRRCTIPMPRLTPSRALASTPGRVSKEILFAS